MPPMNRYQMMMIRAVRALNLLKKLCSQEDWEEVVDLLEIQAISLSKQKGKL